MRNLIFNTKVTILRAIELNQDDIIEQLLSEKFIDFSLVQPMYVSGNLDYPEYDICSDIIRKAYEVNNTYVVEQMLIKV